MITDAFMSKLVGAMAIALLLSAGCSSTQQKTAPPQSSVNMESRDSESTIAASCVDGATQCVGGCDTGQTPSGFGKTYVCRKGEWLFQAGCGSCLTR